MKRRNRRIRLEIKRGKLSRIEALTCAYNPKRIPAEYKCHKCYQPFCEEHAQYRGQRYCPKVETISRKKWLAQKRSKPTVNSDTESSEDIEEAPPRKTPKHVLCKHCNTPFYKTPGHTQFRGKKYYHKVEKSSKRKWLAKQREDIGILPCIVLPQEPCQEQWTFKWGTFIAPKNTRGFQLVHGEKRYGVCALQNQPKN